MTDNAATSAENTYSYYPVYQALFETADMASMFWQPLLKAVGRSQLELAALQARQARAVMQWSQQILQPTSPLDIINTNAQLWQTMTEQYVDVRSARRGGRHHCHTARWIDRASDAGETGSGYPRSYRS